MKSGTIRAPLSSFMWSGADFVMPCFGRVVRFTVQPDVSEWDDLLARIDHRSIALASHWLEFRQRDNERLGPSEKINLFLLSLWLVKPTMVHVKFRFDKRDDGTGGVRRLLSTFGWMEEDVKKEAYSTDELETASQYVTAMVKVSRRRKRVWNALLLTFEACIAYGWQVRFVCFSAAAEALLKYEERRGIARQVATSYACLVARTRRERDKEYRAFRKSYETRSEVVHGRADRLQSASRLRKLARMAAQLRRVWRAVLLSPELRGELDGDNASRKKLLETVERGYSPPF